MKLPTMRGENIIVFAKDWGGDPTSSNHVMKMLARDNNVLWLNSVAMRKPDLKSGRDLGKIVRKVGGFLRGPQRVDERFWVYTPLVVPLPHSAAAAAVNRQIVRVMLAGLRRYLGMDRFQLWMFMPSVLPYVGTLGESVAVYYCTDDHSNFSNLDGRRVAAQERELARKVDVIFATSRSLVERLKKDNHETHLASHGVDQAHFARALAPETEVPGELAGLPRPVVGFFGLIEDWVDVPLMAELARRRPDWSFVIVGKALASVAELERLPNVRLLGRRPYEQLPAYCKGFDVGIIPFTDTELVRHVNPLKLREYLSAGLPVVSSDIPACHGYDSCRIARTADEWVAAIEASLADNGPEGRQARSERMKSETWEHKVAEISAHVMRVRERTRGERP